MTTRAQRDFLKAQLLDTQRLRDVTGDHPLMSVALAERERELQERIAALPLGSKEARTVLFFSGEPVQGSIGIDASFAGRVLEPFQDMVIADYADRWHGSVGSRAAAQERASRAYCSPGCLVAHSVWSWREPRATSFSLKGSWLTPWRTSLSWGGIRAKR